MATQDPKDLPAVKKKFQNEVQRLNNEWEAYAKFKRFYVPAVQLGFSDLKQQAVETDKKLDNTYFFKKFGINLDVVSSSFYKDFKYIDTYVKSNNLKLDQFDRARLAHYNLLDIIYGIDNYQSFMDTDIVRSILIKNKSVYYQYYLDKMPIDQLKNKIVITIAEAYYNEYYKTLSNDLTP